MDNFSELVAKWAEYKEAETAAVQARRELEDEMAKLAGVTQAFDGTIKVEGIKITGRLSYKVDADALRDIITEIGESDTAERLFRWKPELNVRAFKEADEETAAVFADCLTLQASRPSFAIDTTNKE